MNEQKWKPGHASMHTIITIIGIGRIEGRLRNFQAEAVKYFLIFLFFLVQVTAATGCVERESEFTNLCEFDASNTNDIDGKIIKFRGKLVRMSSGYGFLLTNDECGNEKGIPIEHLTQDLLELFEDSFGVEYNSKERFAIKGEFIVRLGGEGGPHVLGELIGSQNIARSTIIYK